MIQKISVHIFQKYYIDLIEFIIDNRMVDLYMFPTYLLQFAFEYKSKELLGLELNPSTLKYCIIPSDIGEQERNHPLISKYYSIEAHSVNYEKLLQEIFIQKLQDSSLGERIQVMNAFFALHCIVDHIRPELGYDILP